MHSMGVESKFCHLIFFSNLLIEVYLVTKFKLQPSSHINKYLTIALSIFSMGRRPVFYFSAILLLIGRIATIFSASTYVLFAAASIISMLTSMSIFLSPLIIAMETSKEEDRGKIAMLQCVGWTIGLSIMPMVFWVVRDWTWFLLITSAPIVMFAMWPKYMIESPR